jgi:two-component sensor histidine kinase
VEHAFGPDPSKEGTDEADGDGSACPDAPVGHVVVTLVCSNGELSVEVRDDGWGLPEGFDIERTTSLGLSIVRDLVVSQLGGSITMAPVSTGGTTVRIVVPPREPAGSGG